jgi:RNA 3'-terminal phosphate cyclase (ATP)
LDIGLDIVRRGYYPQGGGLVNVHIPPRSGPIPAITLTERGSVTRVFGTAYVAGRLSDSHATAFKAGADAELKNAGYDADIKVERQESEQARARCHASGILLFAETDKGCVFGASRLGSRKSDDEELGRDAARELIECLNIDSCVDEWTQVSYSHGVVLSGRD